MKLQDWILASLMGTAFLCPNAAAQREREERMQRMPHMEGPRQEIPQAPAPSVVASPSAGHRNSGASVGSPAGPSPGHGHLGGGGQVVVPVQTYTPQYRINQWHLYETQRQLMHLWNRFQFLPMHESLWRYAQGDSPLTPTMIRFGLQDSLRSSKLMNQLVDALEAEIVRFENGELDRRQLEESVEEKTKEIRQLAKQIRRDDFLDYLDQRKDLDSRSYSQARTPQDLRNLVLELRRWTASMEDRLSRYYAQDKTRVVEVEDLRQPSFKSVSKEIDKLAKTIEKSCSRM